jgi:UDP:flavonoid glycosyltransferase YjiC (YdhE family)
VRVLAATTRGAGHFGPLVPVARACIAAGHEVVVAAPGQTVALVERAGLEAWPLDDPPQDELDAVFAPVPSLPFDEQNEVVLREVFGRVHAGAHLPRMRAALEELEPDVVLREQQEYASAVAAEEAGVPHARVAVSIAMGEEWPRAIAVGGLEAVAAVEPAIAASPYISSVPPTFEHPDLPGPRWIQRHRPPPAETAPAALPAGWWPEDSRPLVYVSFGSVAPTFGFFGMLLESVIAQLASLDVRVLVTVGEALDPASLPDAPPGVRIEGWVPQADVLPHASAFLTHGGFGSTLGGLLAGVPLVVLPLFADQPYNAERVAAVHAGIALELGAEGLPRVGHAVNDVLADPSYAEFARALAAEAADQPPLDDTVALLEELAARR